MNRMGSYCAATFLFAVFLVSVWVSPVQAGDPWGKLLAESDANGDGRIQQNEEPPKPGIDPYFNFSRIDTNGDGSIDAVEYEESIFKVAYREGFEAGLVAYWANNSTRDVLVNRGYGPQKNLKEMMAQLAEPAKDLKVAEQYGTRGIFVAVKPADLDLYKALLKEPFRVPEEPTVTFILLSYGSYYEGMIMLKADCPDGAETWVVLSMPVRHRLKAIMGLSWGFPKYIADELTLTKTKAVVTYEGEVQYSLTLTPGEWDDERAGIEPKGGAYGVNNMAVFHPAGVGPWRTSSINAIPIRFVGREVSTQEQVKGMVKIEVNPKAPWAGLIPNGTVAPGMWQRFVGGAGAGIIKVKS